MTVFSVSDLHTKVHAVPYGASVSHCRSASSTPPLWPRTRETIDSCWMQWSEIMSVVRPPRGAWSRLASGTYRIPRRTTMACSTDSTEIPALGSLGPYIHTYTLTHTHIHCYTHTHRTNCLCIHTLTQIHGFVHACMHACTHAHHVHLVTHHTSGLSRFSITDSEPTAAFPAKRNIILKLSDTAFFVHHSRSTSGGPLSCLTHILYTLLPEHLLVLAKLLHVTRCGTRSTY